MTIEVALLISIGLLILGILNFDMHKKKENKTEGIDSGKEVRK